MIELLTVSALLLAALIHLPPVIGVMGDVALARLYGITPSEPAHSLLLRHRAVFFGIVAGVLVQGAFSPFFRTLALTVGLLSVISFLALAALNPTSNQPIARVVKADWLALAALLVAAVLHALR